VGNQNVALTDDAVALHELFTRRYLLAITVALEPLDHNPFDVHSHEGEREVLLCGYFRVSIQNQIFFFFSFTMIR
jgi:hypothetical protein